jgi:hypothetical protein
VSTKQCGYITIWTVLPAFPTSVFDSSIHFGSSTSFSPSVPFSFGPVSSITSSITSSIDSSITSSITSSILNQSLASSAASSSNPEGADKVKKTNVGIIVGTVLGAVAFCIVVGVFLFLYVKKKRLHNETEEFLQESDGICQETQDQDTNSPENLRDWNGDQWNNDGQSDWLRDGEYKDGGTDIIDE